MGDQILTGIRKHVNGIKSKGRWTTDGYP